MEIKMKDRIIDNLAILDMLFDYITSNPDQRFGQALRNLGIVTDVVVKDSAAPEQDSPQYYLDRSIIMEEPGETLKKIDAFFYKNNKND